MAIAMAPELGLEDNRVIRRVHIIDELEGTLHLATQLSNRLSEPIDAEHAQGVRMRLVRAHALSVVDLLSDILRNCTETA